MEWFRLAWGRYAEFGGRSRRQEYWMFTLIQFLIVFTGYIVGLVLIAVGIGAVILGLCFLYSLISFIPAMAVSTRRLHDTGKSGWFMLIGFIPFVGGIILIILLASDGDPGMNQYGPNPKLPMPYPMPYPSAGPSASPLGLQPQAPFRSQAQPPFRSQAQLVSTFAGGGDFGFCGNCGTKQQRASSFCGSCGAKLKETVPFCGNCGAKLQDASQFCNGCGTHV